MFHFFLGYKAMKDRLCKKPSPSVKNEMNKDEFDMSLAELDIPNMDEHLNGMLLFNNTEKMGHKRTTDQKKLETGYWPERVSDQPRTREPRCRLSLKEKFSSWGSPSSPPKGSTGISTVMHEDKPSFMSTENKPASKVRSVFHGPDDVIFEDDIQMQHPTSDIFSDEIELSNPFHAKDLQSNIDMGTLFGHMEDKKHEDKCVTLSNRNADIFPAKKAVSSVKQTFVRQHTCSQPSGPDSFRHGFSPGFSFRESEPNKFLKDNHFSNDIFQGELGGLLAREKSAKNDSKIEASEKPDTEMFTKTCQLSVDHRNDTNGTETCSDGSEVFNYSKEQRDQSAASKQIPANLSCLQETSAELFQAHTLVRPGTREKL
jgi:hypothetical protein